ncbi:metallophosphoesterase [Lysinibacillus endophyticus]|uniref:Metallophosphoesterase n=1 Tax=Ureibacillus endophyticus TaxID=1978490 RepID=A0A494Z8K5_9BACL|nr:metallophosphoesterase [Lysinibacillus endophyticus]MCP1143302.1 metallophosphoesterase [Lysinibacillus endophyticus]RKQ18945.1 metallophosphoesterase [Lysinibacillus endophyticus]
MKKILILFSIIIGVYLFLYINNHWIVITEHIYESEEVPKSFNGLRIAQVSDLHDATFGIEQGKLVEKVRESNPDIIVITGDVIDSNRYDLQQSLNAVEQFVEIAEVYYVIGNHEVAINEVSEIYGALKELGVHVLPNTSVTLERNEEYLNILGIEDPLNGYETQTMLNVAKSEINEDYFTILLAHRPEMFYTYVVNNIDLVFSGHAHGGQVRIPFIGGLFAPSQGFFPTYTAGVYEEDETTMAVSRGLGNSTVPFRILNLPEIVVVELKTK